MLSAAEQPLAAAAGTPMPVSVHTIDYFIHGAAIGARPVRRQQRVSLAREIRNLPQRQTGPHARPRDQSQPQSKQPLL